MKYTSIFDTRFHREQRRKGYTSPQARPLARRGIPPQDSRNVGQFCFELVGVAIAGVWMVLVGVVKVVLAAFGK